MNRKRREKKRKQGDETTGMDCSWGAQSATSRQQLGVQQQQQQPPQQEQAAQEPKFCKNRSGNKLLSSKSLSQLVPKSLFFRKRKPNEAGLATTKSFPSAGFQRPTSTMMASNESAHMPMESTQFINRIQSASLLGLPRESSANGCGGSSHDYSRSIIDQPNLSPIVGQNEACERVCCEMSWTETTTTTAARTDNLEQDNGQSAMDVEKEKKKVESSSKYRQLFKGTGPVLRDVKNSLALRIKAKHESQAFTRLTNELATPPVKLYSPFDIYTDTSFSSSPSQDTSSAKQTARRKLNLNAKSGKPKGGCGDQSLGLETPKGRIALQHKRHLMQASKFAFDSPTGRLRETVKEVEHFQQCIEDISEAIKARDSPKVWKKYPPLI